MTLRNITLNSVSLKKSLISVCGQQDNPPRNLMLFRLKGTRIEYNMYILIVKTYLIGIYKNAANIQLNRQ